MQRRRRIDNGICCGELVLCTDLPRRQGYLGVERHDDALPGKGRNSIGIGLTDLSVEPFGEFKLNDGRHQPFLYRWDFRRDGHAGGLCGEPLDLGRGVHDLHQ